MNHQPPSRDPWARHPSTLLHRRKVRCIIMSSLPKRMAAAVSNDENDASSDHSKNDVSPQDYLVSLLESRGAKALISPSLAAEGFFADPTEDEINAYAHDVLGAIRARDIERLREFHESGRPLKCSNSFGRITTAFGMSDEDSSRLLLSSSRRLASRSKFAMTMVEHHCMMPVGHASPISNFWNSLLRRVQTFC